jgi:hypothetical protein
MLSTWEIHYCWNLDHACAETCHPWQQTPPAGNSIGLTGIILSSFITLILKNSNYFAEILVTTNTSVSQSFSGHRQLQQCFLNVFITIKTFGKHFLGAPSIATVFFECFNSNKKDTTRCKKHQYLFSWQLSSSKVSSNHIFDMRCSVVNSEVNTHSVTVEIIELICVRTYWLRLCEFVAINEFDRFSFSHMNFNSIFMRVWHNNSCMNSFSIFTMANCIPSFTSQLKPRILKNKLLMNLLQKITTLQSTMYFSKLCTYWTYQKFYWSDIYILYDNIQNRKKK